MNKFWIIGICIILLFGCLGEAPPKNVSEAPPPKEPPKEPEAPPEEPPEEPETPPGEPPKEEPETPPGEMKEKANTLGEIYKLQLGTSFTYQTSMLGFPATQELSVSIKEGGVIEGKETILQETKTKTELSEGEPFITTVKTWVDKTTYECVKNVLIVPTGIKPEETREMEVKCGEGTGTPEINFSAKITYKRTEEITVPAGTYTTDVYEMTAKGETATYWVAKNIPVPVKIESNVDKETETVKVKFTMIMELLSFTRSA